MANDGQAATTESAAEVPLDNACSCKALRESLRSDLCRSKDLDEVAFAKMLMAFCNSRSELESYVCRCKQVAEEGEETEVSSKTEWSLSAAQFVDAIKSERPGVDWGKIAAALDFDGFHIFDRNAFVSLMEVFQLSTTGGFPLEAVLGMVWRNEGAQLDFLRHAVKAPPRLFAFRVDQLVFPVSILEAGKSSSGTDDHAWVSLDLLETLYMLAKGRHEPEVRKIMDHLVKHCKEFLLVALDRMGVPECDIFQEAYRNLVEHFLRQSLCSSDSDPEEVCTTVKNMVLECAMRQQQKATNVPEDVASECLVTGKMGSQSNRTEYVESSGSDIPSQPDSAHSSTGTCTMIHCVSQDSSVTDLSDQWCGAASTTGSDSSTTGALVTVGTGVVQAGDTKLGPLRVGESQDSGESDSTDIGPLDSNSMFVEKVDRADEELQLCDHGLLKSNHMNEQSLVCEVPDAPNQTLVDAGCSRYPLAPQQPLNCFSRTASIGVDCTGCEGAVYRKAGLSPLSACHVTSYAQPFSKQSQRKDILFEGCLYPSLRQSTVNKTLREARLPHRLHPTPELQSLIYSVTTDIQDFPSLAAKICSNIPKDYFILLADALLCRHVVRSELSHQNCLNLINAVDCQRLRECILEVTYHYIYVFLHSKRLKTEIVDQNSLKHLGAWLGQITLARCRPIRLRDLNLKAVLEESWREGSLPVVLPFVRSVLMSATGSLVFTCDNPWIKGLLVSLSAIHANGPVIVRSEVEKIFGLFSTCASNFQCSASSGLHSVIPRKSRGPGTSRGGFYRNPPWLLYQPTFQSRQPIAEQNSSSLHHNVARTHQLTSNRRNKQNGGITAPILDRRLQGAIGSPSQLSWSHRALSDGAWTEVPSNFVLDRSDMTWHHPRASVVPGFCQDEWICNSSHQRLCRNSMSPSVLYGTNRQREQGSRLHLGGRDPMPTTPVLGGHHSWKSWCIADSRHLGVGWFCDSEQKVVENGSSDDRQEPSSSDVRDCSVEGYRNNCIDQSNNSGRLDGLGIESCLKGTSSGYESDDHWDEGSLEQMRREGSGASGFANCRDTRLQVALQNPKEINSEELCRKGGGGGKLRGTSLSYSGSQSRDASWAPWHRCTHNKAWKHGSGQKSKSRHSRAVGSNIGPAPPPPPPMHTSQLGTCGPSVVNAGKRRNARARHRRAGQSGRTSQSRQYAEGWKPYVPVGPEVNWADQCHSDGTEAWLRKLENVGNSKAMDCVQLSIFQKVLGPGVLHRLNGSSSSPRSHGSSEVHHSNQGSGDWGCGWGVRDFESMECEGAHDSMVGRWGVNEKQGKDGKQAMHACSKGKLSARQNGKNFYRRESTAGIESSEYGAKDMAAKHKADDKAVEKRRQKRRHRNKKATGGGCLHHQRSRA